MRHDEEPDDPRRRVLIQALAAGLFAAGFPGSNAMAFSLFGDRPKKLPPGQSIYRITGQATVNGKEATMETRIKPGDTVQTAKGSELIFAVGTHAMILRSDSHLVLEAGQQYPAPTHKPEEKSSDDSPFSMVINGLRMLTGKLLTVSRHSPMQVKTVTATIGIRGTGFYLEADSDLTYFCTCYGVTDVVASADPASTTTVVSYHHNRPLYITQGESQGKNIRNAPFINHTDQELTLIEALVGRTTPFIFPNDIYNAPRRDY
ncbi:MAG: FecR family protein [Gallionella sp.]|nr:FecR family protein [Gallionella sp.]